jgi:hypothetical protein|tara:strand:+ start:1612 stop:2415 length:804 start_codon:yes stop_codon:yes gene_type:complete
MYGAMDKFVEVQVQDVAITGTSTADQAGNNKVEDTGAFATGVAVGDILHDTTDDRMYLVAALDSANVLSLTPFGAAVGTGLGTGKSFIIYSATASSKQLLSTSGVVIVENASADPINSEVNVQYCGKDGIAVKITHAAQDAGNEDIRDGFQESITESLIQAWPLVKYTGWSPSNSGVPSIGNIGSLVGGTGYTTASAVATTNSGSGINLTVDYTATAGVITSIDALNGGTGYAVGDVVTVTGGGGDATFKITDVGEVPVLILNLAKI